MNLFASLLWTTVFGIVKQSDLHIAEDGTMESISRTAYPMTRRLDIFKSITRSEDQQHDELSPCIGDYRGNYGSNETIHGILQQMRVGLGVGDSTRTQQSTPVVISGNPRFDGI